MLLRAAAQASSLGWLHRRERGWAGMDWAVGLLGQIGGAVVNNAENAPRQMTTRKGSRREDGVRRELTDPAGLRLTTQQGVAPRPDHHACYLTKLGSSGSLPTNTRISRNPANHVSVFFVNPADLRAAARAGCVGAGRAARDSDKHVNWIVNAGNANVKGTWE